MLNVVIFGATSSIAAHTARLFAQHGDKLFLVGRNHDKLAAVAADVRLHGAHTVMIHAADLDDTVHHPALCDAAAAAFPRLDVVLLAHGVLAEQRRAEADVAYAQSLMHTNFLSYVSLLTLLANRLEAQGAGTLAVISSVAGLRGRQSNYVYGAAKGGLNVFVAGLRNRLQPRGVVVLTVLPGFVETPMTAAFKKGPLWSSPSKAARCIHRAIVTGKDVTYVPSFWWLIMQVMRSIPEFVFKRLRL